MYRIDLIAKTVYLPHKHISVGMDCRKSMIHSVNATQNKIPYVWAIKHSLTRINLYRIV